MQTFGPYNHCCLIICEQAIFPPSIGNITDCLYDTLQKSWSAPISRTEQVTCFSMKGNTAVHNDHLLEKTFTTSATLTENLTEYEQVRTLKNKH